MRRSSSASAISWNIKYLVAGHREHKLLYYQKIRQMVKIHSDISMFPCSLATHWRKQPGMTLLDLNRLPRIRYWPLYPRNISKNSCKYWILKEEQPMWHLRASTRQSKIDNQGVTDTSTGLHYENMYTTLRICLSYTAKAWNFWLVLRFLFIVVHNLRWFEVPSMMAIKKQASQP